MRPPAAIRLGYIAVAYAGRGHSSFWPKPVIGDSASVACRVPERRLRSVGFSAAFLTISPFDARRTKFCNCHGASLPIAGQTRPIIGILNVLIAAVVLEHYSAI